MRTAAVDTLRSWAPTAIEDHELHAEYVAFAAEPATTHRETSPAQHLTASAFVLDEERRRVLLCFHRKGQFWVQFGGHIEQQDASLSAASAREALEESGVRGLVAISSEPVDLNRHALSSAFGSCRVHWDVGFAFTAPPGAQPVISDESDDVAWWPVDALPQTAVTGLHERLARILRTLEGSSSRAAARPADHAASDTA